MKAARNNYDGYNVGGNRYQLYGPKYEPKCILWVNKNLYLFYGRASTQYKAIILNVSLVFLFLNRYFI